MENLEKKFSSDENEESEESMEEEELENLSDEERLRNKMALAIKQIGRLGFHEEWTDFARSVLQKKYPDYWRYRAFHILSGSTPGENTDLWDFPGDDSAEKFLDNLISEKE